MNKQINFAFPFLVVSLLLLSNKSVINPVNAKELETFSFKKETLETLNQMSSFVSKEIITEVNDNYEIYGNTGLKDSEFEKIVVDGEPKIYLNYSLNRVEGTNYNAKVKLKTNSHVYSYNFIENEDISTEQLNLEVRDFVSHLDKYFNIDWAKIDKSRVVASINDVPQTFVNCITDEFFSVRYTNRGFVSYHIGVSEYAATDDSILYIVNNSNTFTPGIYANNVLNLDGYKNFKSVNGLVSMKCGQAYDKNEATYYGIRYGHTPVLKDYWPVQSPVDVTITTSFGATATVGYSTSEGFSIEGSVSYEYSKSFTTEEPRIASTPYFDDPYKIAWSFDYQSNAEHPYNIVVSQMIELPNSAAGMLIGDFRLLVDHSYTLKRGILPSQDNTSNADYIVRAGYPKTIYEFWDGMI